MRIVIILASLFISALTLAGECEFNEFYVEDYPVVGKIRYGYTTDACEIRPNLHLNETSLVQWWDDNDQLMKVSNISAGYEVEGYRATMGASIVWHKNGALSYLDHFAEDTALQDNIWVRAGNFHKKVASGVNWNRKGEVTWVQVLAKAVADSRGEVLAQECQTAFLQDGVVIHAGDIYNCRLGASK